MKKNLLSLTACLIGITAYTQTSDTYINDNVTVKVNPNTLFYHGGNVSIATTGTTEKIINEGNIQIVGNFSNTNTTGKNFVNKYKNSSSYGQLIINTSATSVTGKIGIERSNPSPSYKGNEYPISLPFSNTTQLGDVINAISSNIFKGDCPIGSDCGGLVRYDQSVFEWNIGKTRFDATLENSPINPLHSYLLNLRDNKTIDKALKTINGNIILAGIPSHKTQEYNFLSGIDGYTSSQFSDAIYSGWKNKKNVYGETYDSYLKPVSGNQDNSRMFGKNLHRFGNPYTSNLDLSKINNADSWLKFQVTSGTVLPSEAFKDKIQFKIFKPTPNYTIVWNDKTGNTTITDASTLFMATLKDEGNGSYVWVGSPEALLVRPYETFYIYYTALNTSQNNNSRLVNVKINFNDNHKTFKYNFSDVPTDSEGTPSTPISRMTSNSNYVAGLKSNSELIKNGLVSTNNFTQLEMFLADDTAIKGNALYIANSPGFTEGSTQNTNNNIFLTNSKNNQDLEFFSFNSNDYIAEPLNLKFNNLTIGKSYKVLLNIYEYSILNKVDQLNVGKYYLYDEKTKNYTILTNDTEISFDYDDDTNDRYILYWQEKPKNSSPIIDEEIKEEIKSQTTEIYKNNTNLYVRFENNKTTAKIEVFDLLGRLVSTKSNINTNNDYKLNLNSNIYIVVITYADGKVVTKKSIN